MTTEITDTRDESRPAWVGYDADCAFCVRWAERFRPLLERHGFALVPLQSAAARRSLNLPEAELLEEMRVVTRDGLVFGGADAILHLAKEIPWGWPLFALGYLPGVKPLLRRIYRRIARSRACGAGDCATEAATAGNAHAARSWPGWLPLMLATIVALMPGSHLPAWAWMWAIAFALFGGCKWLTFWNARAAGVKASPAKISAYLFAWVGMDAREFLAGEAKAEKPPITEWLLAVAKTALGAIVVWILARRITAGALWTGWTAMVGLILLLHFGLLHLVSLAWRKAGICAPPLMRAPALSNSLGEFWGARWNTGFHQLASDYVFRPLRRIVGVPAALMLVFLVSGLIHELVITVPARGGYGLPTFYFLAQGAGILFERSDTGRRCGLGRAGRGRVFAWMVTAGPVFWLFPPPFILNVMIPFLKAIHAL